MKRDFTHYVRFVRKLTINIRNIRESYDDNIYMKQKIMYVVHYLCMCT